MSQYSNVDKIKITGNIIQYNYICKRKVWLSSRQISPDQDNHHLEIGRFIGLSTYKREKKEIRLENIVVDISKLDKEKIVVGEVKKSSKSREAAKMQLAFYLHTLKEYGIDAIGELLFPTEKKKEKVVLDEELTHKLEIAIGEIESIAAQYIPPSAIRIRYCTNCAYREFCWS